ncbi:hypothetical protein EMIHUDRAFT_471617 [Emiliania huxleyi CCMP1516]|uniref:ABC1 atypical kinase-like domain-containing protein n=2 Tax=Emiliania huxleyi TaxID=2903 RepID=A0A0D3KB66_EMIH1|nr:hypothetical protein EMIHUDRAFT_471617 [Emiliania huxleyi CCMP1516]EOD33001.1 hypothetical protein EMIHUDRAFT_471617 [Emiliania huxleyi CCMP1516]|eukprot:XP_005785430.1 hypothetical protein EMIHUDRAFT_471617 [Emiliania huxleyi CCMP1516]
MLRRALGLTTVGVGGGAAFAYQWAKEALGEDGLERLIKYDRVAIPAIVQYKWVEARCGKLSRLAPLLFPPVSEEEETARFAVLHERRGERRGAGPAAPRRHLGPVGVTKEEFLAAEKARVEAESREAASRGRLVRQLSHNTYERYIALQRVRAACWRGAARLYNWTIGVLTLGASRYDLAALSAEALIPINAASLVLIDGCFNADPHPGNILYVDSVHPPKLGLIDYGQVKRLTDQQRYDVAKAYLLVEAALRIDPKTDPQADPAAHARAKAAIARHQFETLGVKTEKLDPEVAYEQACVYFGRMDAAWLYPLNVIQWSDSVEARDPLKDISACEYLVMLNMTTMMIRGLGEMLQQYRNLAAVWAPTARRALSEQPGLLETVEAEIRSWHEP